MRMSVHSVSCQLCDEKFREVKEIVHKIAPNKNPMQFFYSDEDLVFYGR